MRGVIIAVAVVACCVVAARAEAYGNYGSGLSSTYLQKGHVNQYSTGGYTKAYSSYPSYSGYSGYGKKSGVKKQQIIWNPAFSLPPSPVLPEDDTIFGGDGTLLMLVLVGFLLLRNSNSAA
ncbi:uncharacterized protein [Argopecten irradians]|uniref:uncharacterized protein n=1 Tax=Argopecten irradians TaxID=31199 RepID=UPI00371010E9